MGRRRKHKNRNLPMGTTQPNGAVVPTVNSLPDAAGQTVSQPNRSSSRVSITRETFIGPMPPPEVLERYEAIYPGAAGMIFEEYKSQGGHRRDLESRVVRSNIRNATIGQGMGFLLLGGIIAGGVFLAHEGRDLAGFGSIVSAIIGGVYLLLKAQQAKRGNLAEKRGEKRK